MSDDLHLFAARKTLPDKPETAYVIELRGAVTYIVRNNGDIVRTDMPFTPSGRWKIRTVEVARPFGKTSPVRVGPTGKVHWSIVLTQMIRADAPLLFKNGKPKFFLGDTDHGTPRLQTAGIVSVARRTVWCDATGTWRWS